MSKLPVFYNKTLKLNNVCIRDIVDEDIENLDTVVIQMENYLRSKGAIPVGPIIQYMQTYVDKDGEMDVHIQFIRQTNTFLSKVEAPYSTQPILRVPNCLFVRFAGEEHHLKYAYDKLNLISYEEDIPLTGKIFTVFTSKNEGEFSADVFMEKAE